jgi:MFS family permease
VRCSPFPLSFHLSDEAQRYMLGQPISAYMLHKVPMGKWISGTVFGWGSCVVLGITASSFGALATSRFFLGMFEAAVTPAFVVITSQYYTRKEHSLRSCIWWSGAAIGAFFGDLVAWGIGHGHGALSPWKYMFITFGSLSCEGSFGPGFSNDRLLKVALRLSGRSYSSFFCRTRHGR